MTDKEHQYFDLLSKDFMSEESDSSNMECIVVHKHSWRSESNLKFIIMNVIIIMLRDECMDG